MFFFRVAKKENQEKSSEQANNKRIDIRACVSSQLVFWCSWHRDIPLITSRNGVNFGLRPVSHVKAKERTRVADALCAATAVRYGCCDCIGYVKRIFQSRLSTGSMRERRLYGRELDFYVFRIYVCYVSLFCESLRFTDETFFRVVSRSTRKTINTTTYCIYQVAFKRSNARQFEETQSIEQTKY